MSGNCKDLVGKIILLTWLVGSYPLNYMSMDNGWGFYDKNPQVTVYTDGNGHKRGKNKGEIILGRIALLVISPLSIPVNGLYMIAESATTFKK